MKEKLLNGYRSLEVKIHLLLVLIQILVMELQKYKKL